MPLHPTAEQVTLLTQSRDDGPIVMLVEYPSRAKFVEMATNPEYLEIHTHREAALSDSRLVACEQLSEDALRPVS